MGAVSLKTKQAFKAQKMEVANDRREVENTSIAIPESDDLLHTQNPEALTRMARLIHGHMLLPGGQEIAHIVADDGGLSHALALTNPFCKFTAFVQCAEKCTNCLNDYKLPNLTFKVLDLQSLEEQEGRYDGLVICNVIEHLYSGAADARAQISAFLDATLKLLKTGGQLFIKDYALPEQCETVILEVPHYEDGIDDADKFSWFVDARTKAGDAEGWAETMDSDNERTALFKTPFKTAYEFLLHKDKITSETSTIPPSFTHFTSVMYQALLENLQARVLYMSPHRDASYIKRYFEGRFRVFSEDGENLGYPATSYFIVAQKTDSDESLFLFEEEPDRTESSFINIRAVRNEVTGKIMEIAEKDNCGANIIPYRKTAVGRLNVFLTDSMPRCLANTAVPLKENLDARQWSGHMVEALSVDLEDAKIYEKETAEEVARFMDELTGLKTKNGTALEKGPSLYLAPDYIDELRHCYYTEIIDSGVQTVTKPPLVRSKNSYKAQPVMREFDAQFVLNALRLGRVPNVTLEVQITTLMETLGIEQEIWENRDIPIDDVPPENQMSLRELEKFLFEDDAPFEEIRERPGHLNAFSSVFVEEGKVENTVGKIGTYEEDFVMYDKNTVNTAIVLPLTRDFSGEVLAGFEAQHLPVPQRYKGTSGLVKAPSFPLPDSVTNIDMAKEYVAKQFKVTPDRVGLLGESYFCDIDMTPHRIYPFVVASAGQAGSGWGGGVTCYAPMRNLWLLMYQDQNFSFMLRAAMACMRYTDTEHAMSHEFSTSVYDKITNVSAGSYTDAQLLSCACENKKCIPT